MRHDVDRRSISGSVVPGHIVRRARHAEVTDRSMPTLLSAASLTRPSAETTAARVFARLASVSSARVTHAHLGNAPAPASEALPMTRVTRNVTTRATDRDSFTEPSTSSFDASVARSSTSASTSGVEMVSSPFEGDAITPGTDFAPQVQVGPTVASLVVFVTFAVVNRRVAAAVEKRKEREDAEEKYRGAKLRSLDGSADEFEVRDLGDALETAREEEARAREVFAFLGADVRVRVPQPLGKPIAEVEEEETRVAREIDRRRSARMDRKKWDEQTTGARENVSSRRDDSSESAEGPPGWMTATVGFVLLILTWSAVGLVFSPDPAVGPALTPQQVREQMAVKGWDSDLYR